VTTERLDEHLPDGWLQDFVKIDVEGAERLVLEGAMRTFRPRVSYEHSLGQRPSGYGVATARRASHPIGRCGMHRQGRVHHTRNYSEPVVYAVVQFHCPNVDGEKEASTADGLLLPYNAGSGTPDPGYGRPVPRDGIRSRRRYTVASA
jgi:hypothetical protein